MGSREALRQQVTDVVSQAGYGPDEPVLVGIQNGNDQQLIMARGSTGDGRPFDGETIVYAASLAKQVTGACLALLVQQNVVDMNSSLGAWIPSLPAWAGKVRLHHLLHHTSGMPTDSDIDAAHPATETDRTSASLLRTLARFGSPRSGPGSDFAYSNVGYICLAAVLEKATEKSLQDFAHENLFDPLGLSGTRFWSGPVPKPPDAAPLTPVHPAPLSMGDGGMWSTARDLLRWCDALNHDRLGVCHLIEEVGRLDDGGLLDYAWGVGVRSHDGHRVFRHGGGWENVRALSVRVPELQLSIVTLALSDRTERRIALMDGLLDLLITPEAPSE